MLKLAEKSILTSFRVPAAPESWLKHIPKVWNYLLRKLYSYFKAILIFKTFQISFKCNLKSKESYPNFLKTNLKGTQTPSYLKLSGAPFLFCHQNAVRKTTINISTPTKPFYDKQCFRNTNKILPVRTLLLVFFTFQLVFVI